MTEHPKKGSNRYTELMGDLPEFIELEIDWDWVSENCDATRTNCAMATAFKRVEPVTRPSFGVEGFKFIWKGDASVVAPTTGEITKVVALNDLASAGDIPWPTGKQTVRVPLEEAKLRKDLLPGRNKRRERYVRNPEWFSENNKRYSEAVKNMAPSERIAKKIKTEKLKGRLV